MLWSFLNSDERGEKMKTSLLVASFLCSLLPLVAQSTENFDIVVKSKWRNLDQNPQSSIDFGGKWILVGSITFKKKSKEPICIETLSLQWNGKEITNLIASLYKKNFSKEFLPIEKYLICDGIWNKAKQTLLFNFEEKETLAPTTTFYLVLTIPESIEHTLKTGTFLLNEHCLPKPFKHCTQATQLSLAINESNRLLPSHPTT